MLAGMVWGHFQANQAMSKNNHCDLQFLDGFITYEDNKYAANTVHAQLVCLSLLVCFLQHKNQKWSPPNDSIIEEEEDQFCKHILVN